MIGMIIASCGNAMYGKTYWVRLAGQATREREADLAESMGFLQCYAR